jgi:hypothetical protein
MAAAYKTLGRGMASMLTHLAAAPWRRKESEERRAAAQGGED